MMQKIYEAIAATRKVYVHHKHKPKTELERHVRHSRYDFSWGYLGSGPAELACCILWDYLGSEPHAALYQKFKQDYIARFRVDQSWILGSVAIEAWLDLNKDLAQCFVRSFDD